MVRDGTVAGATVDSGAILGLRAVIRGHRFVGDEAVVGVGAVVLAGAETGAVVIRNTARQEGRSQ